MAFVHECKEIMAFVMDGPQVGVRAMNEKLLDIFEGNLLPYVEADMRVQFSEKYFEQVKHRISPINVLKKLIDKTSKIYKDAPNRTVDDGADDDKALVKWYEDKLGLNQALALADEFFSLTKAALIQVAIDVPNQQPLLRVIPGNNFTPYSNNRIDPTKPTHIATLEGKTPEGAQLYAIYGAEEFAIVNEKGIRETAIMKALDVDGVNPYGALPFVYVNRSRNRLIPKCDTDTLAMVKLLPLMLSDLNGAAMFQCFSILYLINATSQNLTMSPNALWTVVPTNPEKDATVGSIKPEVDIDQVLGLIQSQFALWLNSRGIRPGAVGQLTAENFASGISKMVDEMDTSEERQKQVTYFQNAERELWDLILNTMHPVWLKNQWIENRTVFDAAKTVTVGFHEQLPMVSRGVLVTDLAKEIETGLTTKKRAIKKLNPDMSDDEVEALLAEIEAEKKAAPVVAPNPFKKGAAPDDTQGDGTYDEGASPMGGTPDDVAGKKKGE